MKKGITVEWNEEEYIIGVQRVNDLPNEAKGQYLPELTKILLLDGVDDSTIYHEAIHAVLDMFKSSQENFNALFYSDVTFGEEAFCYYVCDVVEKIKALEG